MKSRTSVRIVYGALRDPYSHAGDNGMHVQSLAGIVLSFVARECAQRLLGAR